MASVDAQNDSGAPSAASSTRNNSSKSNSDETVHKDRFICEECLQQTALYQCPGCNIRTCSLQCCQAHKKRTKCSGKRTRGAYLPLCRMNDNTLRSDYFFMEEVLDTMPRARKISRLAEEGKLSSTASTTTGMMGNTHGTNNNNTNNRQSKNLPKSMASINKKAKRLVQQALRRGITLQIMPPILERHKSNSSWYCGPRDVMTWKVDVVLVPSTTTVSLAISEQEEDVFGVVSKHVAELNANANANANALQKAKNNNDHDPVDRIIPAPLSSSPDDYELLIKRLPSAANNPRYAQLKKNESLRKSLEGLTIVEYPTIYCVPREHLNDFPIGTTAITETTAETTTSTSTTTTTAPTPAEGDANPGGLVSLLWRRRGVAVIAIAIVTIQFNLQLLHGIVELVRKFHVLHRQFAYGLEIRVLRGLHQHKGRGLRRRQKGPRLRHALQGHLPVVGLLGADAVRNQVDVHVHALVLQQVQAGLLHAHVRLDAKEDHRLFVEAAQDALDLLGAHRKPLLFEFRAAREVFGVRKGVGHGLAKDLGVLLGDDDGNVQRLGHGGHVVGRSDDGLAAPGEGPEAFLDVAQQKHSVFRPELADRTAGGVRQGLVHRAGSSRIINL
eukprot:CAMPEP_0172389842 /NCGR_PEP_ID=MMETSP1061-20121228/6630_1 /TAXON_ID=37318 /ORGANISM="Pseudo-nitzschia pungens, Strain cf. pungens" /LENGTH=613 /DNA_ID=CAMNT_0013120075 /DNA_START=194 /DNA_END=2034 /DNA_ORIENTATION=+